MPSSDQSLNRRRQYAAYFALATLALIFTVVLVFSPGEVFQRFLGETSPILVVAVATGIGALALWFLQSKYEFVIFGGRRTLSGVAVSAVLATALAVAATYYVRKCRAHLLIFGKASVRRIDGRDYNVLRLRQTVVHRRIPKEWSQEFGKEMAQIFPELLA